jgi:hypothetical protein
MKRVLFAALLGIAMAGCSTTPRGGTSDVSTDTTAEYGEASSDVGTTDFGRGSDRFSQESTRMLPGAESDWRTFRQ